MTTDAIDLDHLPEYLSAEEVATSVIRCQVDYVTRQCKKGNLKATFMGGRIGWRIHRDDLRAFLGGGTTPPARERPKRERTRAR